MIDISINLKFFKKLTFIYTCIDQVIKLITIFTLRQALFYLLYFTVPISTSIRHSTFFDV